METAKPENMETEQQKIQALLDSGTAENIDLAFALMRSTGILVKLPSKKDVADWIAYNTSASDDIKKMLKLLVDEKPLALHQAKKALQAISDCGHFSIDLSYKKQAFTDLLHWLKWLTSLNLYTSQKTNLKFPDFFRINKDKLDTLTLSGNIIWENDPARLAFAEAVNNITWSNNSYLGNFPAQGEIWQKLDTLYLESCKLSCVNLDRMPQLKTLRLYYSNNRSLDIDIIANQPTPCLEEIEITDANINALNIKAWEMMPLLKSLSLAYIYSKNFDPLPPALAVLTGLHQLHISDSSLKSLPDFIGNFTLLKDFSVTSCSLKKIPDCIGNLVNLEILYFNSNEIKTLPPAITALKQLKTLDLSYNHLKKLPDFITELTALESIDLTGNPLESIPENIGDMPNLSSLRISGDAAKNTSIAAIWKKFPSIIEASY